MADVYKFDEQEYVKYSEYQKLQEELNKYKTTLANLISKIDEKDMLEEVI